MKQGVALLLCFSHLNKRCNRHRAGSTDALLYLPIDEGVTLAERLYRYYGIRYRVAHCESSVGDAPLR